MTPQKEQKSSILEWEDRYIKCLQINYHNYSSYWDKESHHMTMDFKNLQMKILEMNSMN